MHSIDKTLSAELFLSNQSGDPIYQQIVDQILARVMAGDWPQGHALPSIRELASSNSVSVITVKRAYLELERAGVIVTQQGKGSFVSNKMELPKSLLQAELAQHLRAALSCARKLGLSAKELPILLQQVEAEDGNADDRAAPETPSPRP